MEKRVKAIVRLGSIVAVAVVATAARVQAQAVPIVNPGFESGLTGWSTFGNTFFVSNPAPTPTGAHSGTNSAKEFGTFPGVSGAFQQFAAAPGDTLSLSGFILNSSSDAMQGSSAGGTNFALIKISFHNAGGEILGQDSQHITVDTPQDAWQPVNALATAPAGTTFVQLFCLFVQPHTLGGSAFFDDISAVVIPEPTSIVLVLGGVLGLVAVARRRRA